VFNTYYKALDARTHYYQSNFDIFPVQAD